MKFVKRFGETGVMLRVFVQNSTVTTGAGLTGLTYNSSGLVIALIADVSSVMNSYSQGSGQIEAITTCGTWAAPTSFKIRFGEVNATYLPGLYELQLDNALFTTSGMKALQGMVFGAASMAPTPFELQLDAGEVVADQLLARNLNGGSNSGRLVKQALHFLRNKWTSVSGTLTVYDTDDSTTSWTATTSSDAAAPPVTGSDPA